MCVLSAICFFSHKSVCKNIIKHTTGDEYFGRNPDRPMSDPAVDGATTPPHVTPAAVYCD